MESQKVKKRWNLTEMRREMLQGPGAKRPHPVAREHESFLLSGQARAANSTDARLRSPEATSHILILHLQAYVKKNTCGWNGNSLGH